METQIVEVEVIGRRKTKTSGKVHIEIYSSKERLFRTLKTGGIFFGLALVSVLIPLAHFVLVPLFLLITLFMVPITYGQVSTIKGGTSICPDCQADFKIEQASDKWPLEDTCAQCHSHVTIHKI